MGEEEEGRMEEAQVGEEKEEEKGILVRGGVSIHNALHTGLKLA